MNQDPSSIAESDYPDPRYAWYVAAILSLGYAFAFMDRLIIGTLTPAIQADLHLDDTQAGYLQGLAFALCYTVFGLPLGWYADRGNRKKLLAVGMTIWSVMASACGLVRGFPLLFLARVGVGVGEATLNPCATSLIGDYFPPRTRSRAFGLFVSATAAGSLLSFTGVGLIYRHFNTVGGLALPLFGLFKPWQATFLVSGLPGLIPALLLALTVREPPRLGAAKRADDAALGPFLKANARTLFCHHVGIAMIFVATYGYLTWLPTLFQRTYGWDVARFSIVYGPMASTLSLAGAMISGFIAAWLKRRGDAVGTLRVCAIGGLISSLGSTVGPLQTDGTIAFACYMIPAFFNNFVSALGLAAITEMAPNQLRARVTAIYVVGTGLLSATLGPLLVGIISDALRPDPAGIAHGLALTSGLIGVPGALLVAWGWKPYRDTLARVG